MNTYSVLESMSKADIATVLDHRERINRKFDSNEIGHTLRDIAERFLRGYRGEFPYLLDMQSRLERYGKLFASQSASVLNCLYAQVVREMQQDIRQEKHQEQKAIRTRKVSVSFGTGDPSKGPRPIRGSLFSDQDMDQLV